MGRSESGNSEWSRYDESFREDAHQLLVWGYEGSRQLITATSEETEITGFIAEAIDAKLNACDTDERFDRYCIKEDNPTAGENRKGKRRRRLDITIECTFRPRYKPRPRYIFEAKRLCRPGHLIGNYVGDEGLRRFTENKYAPDCPEVAMIGYVQSDEPHYWLKRLEQEFNSSAAELRVRQNLFQITVVPSLTHEWASKHNRSTGDGIVIYHIFLDCCSSDEPISK